MDTHRVPQANGKTCHKKCDSKSMSFKTKTNLNHVTYPLIRDITIRIRIYGHSLNDSVSPSGHRWLMVCPMVSSNGYKTRPAVFQAIKFYKWLNDNRECSNKFHRQTIRFSPSLSHFFSLSLKDDGVSSITAVDHHQVGRGRAFLSYTNFFMYMVPMTCKE